MPNLIFHHIGIATPTMDETAAMYVEAGYEKTATTLDPLQDVNICFLTKEGMPTIELLSPVDETSPVVKFIEKNGVTPYHCCYISHDLEADIAALKRQKYVVVSKPKEACAMGGKRVCFLFNKYVGLIELVER